VRRGAEGSRSFLTKGGKKLLPVAGSIRLARLNSLPDAMYKSVLLLFFKNEEVSCFPEITEEGQ
jgi:hypothetical protein